MSDRALRNKAPLIPKLTSKSPIEQAIKYVHERVQLPALLSSLPDPIKRKVRHADIWLSRFRRVGDLLAYLKRFDASHDDPVYRAMSEYELLTFEDIVGEFEEKFGQWANDCSRISDFIIGQEYSAFDILILARNYETRAGGMFVLEANGIPTAVIIKATLKDGKYANEWIEEPTILKYYLKSIGEKFGEHYKANKAILTSPGLPIVTFVRDSKKERFVFKGVFRNQDLLREESGAKAFVLAANPSASAEITVDLTYVTETLARQVNCSDALLREDRLRRLAKAPKLPTKIYVISTAYTRNADVIVEVLHRAKGKCEKCIEPAPFLRATNGTPYLEVHHKIPLAKNGEDTVANAIALCPNCHRQLHYGDAFSRENIDPVTALDVSITDGE